MHRPWLESFLFAVALAVMLTPELLPMVVSLTLSRGALHMAKKRVIVKQLASIQNLGSMDVLCTDKTGTLTEAKIKLEQHVDRLGKPSARVLELAYLNSLFETGLKSPLDEAILTHEEIDVSVWKKIDEVPFDFERRRVSVLADKGNGRLLVVKGASEEIIGLCTHYEEQGSEVQLPLDRDARQRIHGQHAAMEKQGFRVLGTAWREVPPDHPHAVIGDEVELVFAGFAGFLDPPKESAGAALFLPFLPMLPTQILLNNVLYDVSEVPIPLDEVDAEDPFRSRPHRVLAVTSIVVAAIGAVLPFTPVGTYFGFVPLPTKFYLILAAMVVIYLLAVELAKMGFYRWHRATRLARLSSAGH